MESLGTCMVSLCPMTDPEEAVLNPKKELYLRLLEAQLKLHLLLAEHLVISDGFLFDNPGLWHFLGTDPYLAKLLLERWDSDAFTTLILQEACSDINVDEQFRSWYRRGSEHHQSKLLMCHYRC